MYTDINCTWLLLLLLGWLLQRQVLQAVEQLTPIHVDVKRRPRVLLLQQRLDLLLPGRHANRQVALHLRCCCRIDKRLDVRAAQLLIRLLVA